jgi:hypothetical protein
MDIVIEEKTYKVPNSLAEVSLGRWVKAQRLKNQFENGELTEVEASSGIIEQILNIPIEDQLRLDITSFNKLNEYVIGLYSLPLPTSYTSKNIELTGRKFRFDTLRGKIPVLLFYDLQFYFKQNDFLTYASTIAAALIRPIDEKGALLPYDNEESDLNISLMENELTMGEFNPIATFFLSLYEELYKTNSLTYT